MRRVNEIIHCVKQIEEIVLQFIKIIGSYKQTNRTILLMADHNLKLKGC